MDAVNKVRQKFNMLLIMLVALALVVSGFTPVSYAAGTEQTGNVEWISTADPTMTIKDTYVYSDEWFMTSPLEQNDRLALVSMQLNAVNYAGGAEAPGVKFLSELGFSDSACVNFDSQDPDDCSYTYGFKTIGEGDDACTLIAVSIQSTDPEPAGKAKAWRQNFTVNDETSSGGHYAYSLAADKVIDGIAALAPAGNVKYWITGHSRGGALAGIIAAKLPAKLDALRVACSGIYAYTFESPNVEDGFADTSQFDYIHNYISKDDLFTMLPTWGMKRYGVEHLLSSGVYSEAAEKTVKNQLAAMGSAAAKIDRSSKAFKKSIAFQQSVTKRIREVIQNRNGYSKPVTNSYTTFTYQESISRIMAAALSSGSAGAGITDMIDRIVEMPPTSLMRNPVDDLIDGVIAETNYSDPAKYYWNVADNSLVKGAIADYGLTNSDLFAVFKLAAPLLVDASYTPKNNDKNGYTVRDRKGYLKPLYEIMDGINTVVYAHHFDTVIARLKILTGESDVDPVVAKEPQPMKVTQVSSKFKIKAGTIKKKAVYIPAKKYVKVTGNEGKLTYTKTATKKITVNKNNGKIKVAKGTSKGKYKVTVAIRATGNDNYKPGTKKVTFYVVVK